MDSGESMVVLVVVAVSLYRVNDAVMNITWSFCLTLGRRLERWLGTLMAYRGWFYCLDRMMSIFVKLTLIVMSTIWWRRISSKNHVVV